MSPWLLGLRCLLSQPVKVQGCFTGGLGEPYFFPGARVAPAVPGPRAVPVAQVLPRAVPAAARVYGPA